MKVQQSLSLNGLNTNYQTTLYQYYIYAVSALICASDHACIPCTIFNDLRFSSPFFTFCYRFINFKQIWNIVTYLASSVVSFHFPAVFAISSTPIY